MALFFSTAIAPLEPVVVVSPVLILALCALAGIGTVLLLPSHLKPDLRKIGGTLLLAAGLILLVLVVRYSAGSGQGGGLYHGIYFWIFAAIALLGALRVVTHPLPVYSALYFVLTVFATAGLFILLAADFMAVALVIIYAGAILITYVFVIMLASQARAPDTTTAAQQMAEYDARSRDPFIASAIGFALMGVLLFVIFDKAGNLSANGGVTAHDVVRREQMNDQALGAPVVEGNTQELGKYLFSNQQLSLELAGILLTVSMVGAIIIARRQVLQRQARSSEVVISPATPVNDDPHSIPVYGTDNPNQKAYPET